MSDDKRESKIDINELLNKYLSDTEEPTPDSPVEEENKKPTRQRRRMASRAPSIDRAQPSSESSGDEYTGSDSDGAAESIKQTEEPAPLPVIESEEPAAAGDEDIDTDTPAEEEESVSADPEDLGSSAPSADNDTEDVEEVTAEPDAEEQPYEPDASIFAQYGQSDSESYDYISEQTEENGSDEEDDDSVYALDGGDSGSDPQMDDFDMNILLALGMDDELEQSVGVERVSRFVEKQQNVLQKTESKNRERAALAYEYTTKSQTREVVEMYNSSYRISKLKLTMASVLAFVLFIFENHSLFGIKLGGAFDPLTYPIVYIMVGLQIVLIIAAFSWKSIWNGLRNFFLGKPTPECVAGFAVVFDIIYTVAISFSNNFGESGPETFNLPVAIGLLLLSIYEWLNIRRDRYSFGIISSKNKKFALASLSMAESHLEHEAFSDLMEEGDNADDIGVLKVEGADFVGDFFLRTNRYAGGRKFIGFIIPSVIIVAAVFFAYRYSAARTVYDGARAAVSVVLTCLPVSLYYMFSHPFFRAVAKARDDECTIIGESSVEEYADAAIIAFDDKNVFPSTGVNVRGINVFGNNRIDRVLYTAASVFCTIGGPLSDVFDIATRDIGHSSDVEVVRCRPGLLEVNVNGSNVMFGTIDAIEEAQVRIPRPLDEHRNDEFGDSVCVMYMVEDGKFIARMLIQYLIDADFELILKQLDRSGMFVGVRTFDPNVTESFIGKQIKLKNYPLRVIRCKSLDDRTPTTETTVSGLVSKDSPKALLSTVTLCEKVLHARSINTMLTVISLFVSLVVVALAIVFDALALSSLFIVLYQLFWIIPMYISSRMIIS